MSTNFDEKGNPSWHSGGSKPKPRPVPTPEPEPRPTPREPTKPKPEPRKEPEPKREPAPPKPAPKREPDQPATPPKRTEIPKPAPIPKLPPIEGWRKDVVAALEKLRFRFTDQSIVDKPWLVTANVMTESLGKKGALNKNDGFYKAWGRNVSSVGLFQIREPTGYYLQKNKKRLGTNSFQVEPLPKGTPPRQDLVIKALQKYPSQIWYGMILLLLAVREFTNQFTTNADGTVTAKETADDDVQDYLNDNSTKALTPLGVYMRLYWANSSKGGPRRLVRIGLADKVMTRYAGFIPAEEKLFRVYPS